MIKQDDDGMDQSDGIDWRGFLKCMAWAGTGMLWTLGGGLLSSRVFGQALAPTVHGWSFVQISDSHTGFKKAANHDVISTLQEAVARINALPTPPEVVGTRSTMAGCILSGWSMS